MTDTLRTSTKQILASEVFAWATVLAWWKRNEIRTRHGSLCCDPGSQELGVKPCPREKEMKHNPCTLVFTCHYVMLETEKSSSKRRAVNRPSFRRGNACQCIVSFLFTLISANCGCLKRTTPHHQNEEQGHGAASRQLAGCQALSQNLQTPPCWWPPFPFRHCFHFLPGEPSKFKMETFPSAIWRLFLATVKSLFH